MSVERKLKEWEHAQLIDEGTATRIRDYEKAHHRPYALFVFGGLGGFAVVLGLLSVIASNWDEIPRGVKLAADLLAVSGLGYAVLRFDARGLNWQREMVLTLFFGMVLASIALIGQTYHLGGEPWQALLVWSLVTLPAMATFGRSAFVGACTVLALNASVGFAVFEWAETYGSIDKQLRLSVLCVVLLTAPLLQLALGSSDWFKKFRPEWASVTRRLAWLVVIGASAVSQQAWYGRAALNDTEQNALFIGLGVVTLVTGWLVFRARGMLADATDAQVLSWRVFLVYAVVAGAAPWLAGRHGSWAHTDREGAVSAISFIGFLLLAAWVAYQHGQVGLFNVATVCVAVRLLIVFAEVFSSLLATGVGLIVGGVCVLGMTWLWVKATRPLRTEIRTREAA